MSTAKEPAVDLVAAKLDIERVRADFPILHQETPEGKPLAYLDNAASSQRPRPVIDAVVNVYEQCYANVHRGVHRLSERSTDLYEQAREKVAAFIGAADPLEVIFTSGTTAGINLVARAWGDANLRAGDEILLTIMEHHSNIVPWRQLAERTGAVIRHAPITEDGRLDLDEFDRMLTDRTRLVAVTAVSNVLGVINPVEEIVRRARLAGARVLIDAAQSVPHEQSNVQTLGADFVAFSGHKMLAPTGIGALWARRELLESMPPFLGGGSMIRRVTVDGFEPDDPPAKFEAGTPPIAGAIGLGAAVDYLSEIGVEAIAAHERALAEQAHRALESLGGVRILGPAPEHKAGIVSFVLEGVHAHDVAQILDRHVVAIRAGHHCAMPLHKQLGVTASARASFYLYNTPAEVERLVEGLEDARRVFRRGRS